MSHSIASRLFALPFCMTSPFRAIVMFGLTFAPLSVAFEANVALSQDAPDFNQQVQPLLDRYCASCHNADDLEAGLALDTFAGLAAGGDSGPSVLPSDVEGSRLWRSLMGKGVEKMPPDDMEGPNDEEIALIAAWIKAGAPGPEGDAPRPTKLVVPTISAAEMSELPIAAADWSPKQDIIALGRFQSVELRDAKSGDLIRELDELPGKVNSVRFSADGQYLLTASGVTGLVGEAALWNVATGALIQRFRGHRDVMYAAAISKDAKQVATAAYDGKIHLWSVETGEKTQTLVGHNGAIFDLAYSTSEPKLLSASADETLKVWSLADGRRLDTLGQPLEEQFVGQFSPNGSLIAGGGGDNRIRLWRTSDGNQAKINPLLFSRFGHEGPIVALDFSPNGQWLVSAAEDQTLKLWYVEGLREAMLFPSQPDVVSAIAFAPDSKRMLITRLDGSWDILEVPSELPGQTESQATVATSETMPDAALAELDEQEPNNQHDEAQLIQIPAKIKGTIHRPDATEDFDEFRFASKQGEEWVIEVKAARDKSPLDSRIQIFDTQGEPVPRVLLQAVRDSYFTFRGKDSNVSNDFRLHNWEEMELNEYLYCNGEVVRLWLYPRGPDSGFKTYPGFGNRRTYFDTTATTHALGEPCYIVQPYPVGTELIPNGLPVFTVFYENDDDSMRRWGTDSRLTFVAPEDGEYLLRLSDSRGFSGEDYSYEITVRPRKPDFSVSFGGANPKVSPGSAREFSVTAKRLDDFDGPITVSVDGLPPGFHVTNPVIIEAGQDRAVGVIWADQDAEPPTEETGSQSKVVARASIRGITVEHNVNSLGKIELGDAPKLRVRLAEATGNVSSIDGRVVDNPPEPTPWPEDKPLELTLEAGTTIAARVLVERNGQAGRISFGNEDSGRNLPHGVIVDNIGLNGLLIIEEQQERVFFLTAAKWVPEQTRLFHLQAKVDGNQCSLPVTLKIVRPGTKVATGVEPTPSE